MVTQIILAKNGVNKSFRAKASITTVLTRTQLGRQAKQSLSSNTASGELETEALLTML
jgi:hypothetical protein